MAETPQPTSGGTRCEWRPRGRRWSPVSSGCRAGWRSRSREGRCAGSGKPGGGARRGSRWENPHPNPSTTVLRHPQHQPPASGHRDQPHTTPARAPPAPLPYNPGVTPIQTPVRPLPLLLQTAGPPPFKPKPRPPPPPLMLSPRSEPNGTHRHHPTCPPSRDVFHHHVTPGAPLT